MFKIEKASKEERITWREYAGSVICSLHEYQCKARLTALTKRLGLVDPPDNPDNKLIKYKWDDPHVVPADMTPEVAELFTRELTRYIEETEELAIKGLKDNRLILDMIAKELLERSRITGLEKNILAGVPRRKHKLCLEVEERMKGLSPIMFEDFVKPFQISIEAGMIGKQALPTSIQRF
ncbi:unnamed protein product [Thlaspi arvense]|uniref:Uncharacterized protein n=1 Tax=Thlaspi arvense TaxID=13288 RepID=A0AAU9RG75_THLAR|nr:unnamed protein product [Thlaspi arvense]